MASPPDVEPLGAVPHQAVHAVPHALTGAGLDVDEAEVVHRGRRPARATASRALRTQPPLQRGTT